MMEGGPDGCPADGRSGGGGSRERGRGGPEGLWDGVSGEGGPEFGKGV